MIDPFPVPCPPWLSKVSQPIADIFSLTTLPLHAHELLIAFTFYHIVNTRVSPFVSKRLFPAAYTGFNDRTRINWDVHVVSLVQSSFINALALWIFWHDEERAEMNWKGRVFGYTGAGGMLQAFAAGYFLWDLTVSLAHVDIFGFGLLAHAISALSVFSLGFRPFVNYYGPTFILYELSSPFLNFHWFFDKLNMTGSRAQLYNGIMLLATFFGCRLVWGTYQSGRVAYDVYRALTFGHITNDLTGGAHPAAVHPPAVEEIAMPQAQIMRFAGEEKVPMWLAVSYLAANLTLNMLNFYWFGQMIDALRKRFDPPFGTKGVVKGRAKAKAKEPATTEIELMKGVDDVGRTSVEVHATEVRNRRRG